MKKYLCLFLTTLLICSLVSCTKNNEEFKEEFKEESNTVQNEPILTNDNAVTVKQAETVSSNAETFDISGTLPSTPQPFSFNSIEETIDFIEKGDINTYTLFRGHPEEWKEAYRDIIAKFKSEGYVTVIGDECAKNNIEKITDGLHGLFPCVKYEDIGIRYWAKYKDKSVRITVYNTRSDCTDYADGDFLEYTKLRLGKPMKLDIVDVNGMKVYYAMPFPEDNDDVNAYVFIDRTHYVQVCVHDIGTREFVNEFIKNVTFERIPLK